MPLTEKEEKELLYLLELEEKKRLETSLSYFVREAWKVLEPGTTFIDNWHIDYICEHLELVEEKKIKRLVINIPPRYMKSIIASVCYPVWVWTKNPSERFIATSYAQSLATKHSVDRRRLIQSPWFQKYWGSSFSLTTDQNVKIEFENTKRGHMIATGFDGVITGKGGNCIVIDDPHDPKRAISDTYRNRALETYKNTLRSRLDDKKKGTIILIMQRLHEEDLTGYVISTEEDWTFIKVPGEIKEEKKFIFPKSNREIIMPENSILWEEREDRAGIDSMKKALGAYGFAGQYEQEPAPLEGELFKKKWWKYYDVLPSNITAVIQSWDLAFKGEETSAYVVGQVWAMKGSNKYLMYQYREKVDFMGTIAAFLMVSEMFPNATAKHVEEKANCAALFSVLRGKVSGLIPYQPKGDKMMRAMSVAPQVQAGDVYLPDPEKNPWVQEYIKNFAMFPNGKYKDEIDATSQALDILENNVFKLEDLDFGGLRKKSNWN